MPEYATEYTSPLQESSKDILNDIERIDSELEQLSQSIANSIHSASQNTQEINSHAAQLQNLRESLIELSAKFDVWQSNVEPMLASAQTAMQYDNFIITSVGVMLAITGLFFYIWFNKTKKEAIDEAGRKFDEAIAKGLVPEGHKIRDKLIITVTTAIINSPKFIEAVKQAMDFIEDSTEADEERAEGVDNVTESVDAKALAHAKDVDESPNNETDSNKSSTIKKAKRKE